MLVALNYSDLTDGAIMSPIDYTEYGAILEDDYGGQDHRFVWTNTTAYGQSGGADVDDNCDGWTTTSHDRGAIVGYSPFVEGGWSQKEHLRCDGPGFHLICVEQ